MASQKELSNDANNLINGLTVDTKFIFITAYNLFVGFPKRLGNWRICNDSCNKHMELLNGNQIGYINNNMMGDLTL